MKKLNHKKMTGKDKENFLKYIFKVNDLNDLLYECIGCWKEGTKAGMSKAEEEFHNHTCEMCSDVRKRMCELFQRFECAVTRSSRQHDNKEAVAYINFVNGFKNLTDFYWK